MAWWALVEARLLVETPHPVCFYINGYNFAVLIALASVPAVRLFGRRRAFPILLLLIVSYTVFVGASASADLGSHVDRQRAGAARTAGRDALRRAGAAGRDGRFATWSDGRLGGVAVPDVDTSGHSPVRSSARRGDRAGLRRSGVGCGLRRRARRPYVLR